MKFLHIGDIHIGKLLHQQSLLDIQIDALNQVLEYSNKQSIDVIIMAGDIYDRSIPSKEAVEVLDSFLSKAIFECNKKIIMISGNHDSSERLGFVSDLLACQGLYIVSVAPKKLNPIEIDGINFYPVPFFKPSYIKEVYDVDVHTYQDAFAYYLKQQDIDYTKTNVLIAHQFIAGNKEIIRSDSESVLSVGGSEIIDVSLVSDFDYVALGHIHASQKVSKDTIRYSGSLLKYSFDEVNQKKGMVEVTIEDKHVDFKTVEITPLRDVCKYSGMYKDILEDDFVDSKEDFIAFELEDIHVIPHAIDILKTIYPNVLQITYPNLKHKEVMSQTKAEEGFEKKSTIELFEEFYSKIKGHSLKEESYIAMQKIIEEVNTHETK